MVVLRSGPTGMDAGRAALGQGWPIAACPRSEPARGNLNAAKAGRQGQAFLVGLPPCSGRQEAGYRVFCLDSGTVMGIRVAWTIEWQQQKQKFQTTPIPCGSGLARDGSTSVIQIERGACIAGKPGSHRGNMSVTNPAFKQLGRPLGRTSTRPPDGAVDQNQKPDQRNSTGVWQQTVKIR